MLVFLSILGVLLQVYLFFSSPESSNAVVVLFSVCVVCWASLMMNYWILLESKFALEWGMLDFEGKEKIRPNYQSQGDDATDAEIELRKEDPTSSAIKRSWFSGVKSFLFGGVKRSVSPSDRFDYDYDHVSPSNYKLRG